MTDTPQAASVDDHAYVPPEEPNRFLCAYRYDDRQSCNMAEAAHRTTLHPYEPTSERAA